MSVLTGKRVVARDNSMAVGVVRRLRLDPASARIVALELDGVGDGRTIVDWPAISGIGDDALIIESSADRHAPLDTPEQALASGDLELAGKLVLADNGDAIGTLEDVVFDQESGRLHEIVVPGHSFAVQGVVALGSYALIVPAPA